jgi:hypothetical protein
MTDVGEVSMSESLLCGREISSWIGADCPFDNILFIDYDDGPTFGAAQCRLGFGTYRFELLARDAEGTYDFVAWDRGQEIRIFGLASLSSDQFKHLNKILSAQTSYERMAENATFYDSVRAVLVNSNPVQFVIANHGIRTGIVAARAVAPAELSEVADWFSFLKIERHSPHADK